MPTKYTWHLFQCHLPATAGFSNITLCHCHCINHFGTVTSQLHSTHAMCNNQISNDKCTIEVINTHITTLMVISKVCLGSWICSVSPYCPPMLSQQLAVVDPPPLSFSRGNTSTLYWITSSRQHYRHWSFNSHQNTQYRDNILSISWLNQSTHTHINMMMIQPTVKLLLNAGWQINAGNF